MQISLIQVPYMVGDDRHSASDGPQHLLQNGAANIFTSNGFTVSVDQVERGTAYRDSATASLAVNKNLKKTVHRAVVAEQIPIVLAGSCDVSAGILAGFDHSRCGVVWLDAHGDFNTPESTISGFFAGMSLAVITGHCYRSYWAQIGDNTPVLESATVIFGVRDLDPAEQQRFQQSQIRMVKWRDGNPQQVGNKGADKQSPQRCARRSPLYRERGGKVRRVHQCRPSGRARRWMKNNTNAGTAKSRSSTIASAVLMGISSGQASFTAIQRVASCGDLLRAPTSFRHHAISRPSNETTAA